MAICYDRWDAVRELEVIIDNILAELVPQAKEIISLKNQAMNIALDLDLAADEKLPRRQNIVERLATELTRFWACCGEVEHKLGVGTGMLIWWSAKKLTDVFKTTVSAQQLRRIKEALAAIEEPFSTLLPVAGAKNLLDELMEELETGHVYDVGILEVLANVCRLMGMAEEAVARIPGMRPRHLDQFRSVRGTVRELLQECLEFLG